MNEHTCPVCGYSGDLEFRPRDYQICACCGTEFGYDDRVLSHEQLRAEWLQKGCPWFDLEEPKPYGWNAYDQLQAAKLIPQQTSFGTISRFRIAIYTPDQPVEIRLDGDPLRLELV